MLSAWCVFHVFGCDLSLYRLSSHCIRVCLLLGLRSYRAHGELEIVLNQRIVNKKKPWAHASTNLLGSQCGSGNTHGNLDKCDQHIDLVTKYNDSWTKSPRYTGLMNHIQTVAGFSAWMLISTIEIPRDVARSCRPFCEIGPDKRIRNL